MTSTDPARSRRTVAITGAAQGIGFAIAQEFARNGWHVVIGDLNADAGHEAAEQLKGDYLELDVSDSSSVARFAREAIALTGGVDSLVNNAGIGHEDPALEVSDTLWNRVLSIDLNGSFYASREFGRHFAGRGGGVIVNIASISAFFGNNPEHHVAYDVAKAGIVQLTRSLAVEWAPLGIRVNAVAPGRTRTAILETVGASDPARIEEWLDQVPQHRFFEPSEIAAVVYFLASDASSAITGQTVIADGGHLIH